ERDLDHGHGHLYLFEPGVRPPAYEWMEKLLEPDEPVGVAKHRFGDLAALGRPEALLERGSDLLVVRDQVVDDRVRRQRRGTLPTEGGQRLALTRSDAAGDRDGDRPAHSSAGASPGGGAASAPRPPAPGPPPP